ncbi:guanylate-binding protein 1-like isoform X1 [Hoplias malabaricus]|uniref:guanylate-binding protein 1-like isoform X1 n=1 Tax=Hoplias malabaricus TaxID=27720 RepID=UPI0034637B26
MAFGDTTIKMSAPICLINNTKDGGLVVCEEAMKILDQITQPVVVVAVVGLYRTGKSYLMNRLAQAQTGFPLGNTIESKTKGIWMWCVPHPQKKDHTLVLLDTEGLGDVDKGDEKHDVWIFCMAVLLSSTLVYNSLGTIDNTALEKLHYVAKLTENIKLKSNTQNGEETYNTSTEFMRVFPSFIWTVRDFILRLELNGKPITADEYLENALKLKPGDSLNEIRNKTRSCVREFFAVRKCFVFERPANSKKMMNMESLTDADLEEDFVKEANTFCSYIYSNSNPKTLRGGLGVTGRMLATLAQTYVEAISSGQVPSLDNAVESLTQIQNSRAITEAVDFYRSEMIKKVKFPTETQQELSDLHSVVEKEAISIFIRDSFNDLDQKYQKELKTQLDHEYGELVKQNIEESRKLSRSVIARVFGPLEEELSHGTYLRPGGYSTFCCALEAAVQQYKQEKGLGLMSEEVLAAYLKEKSEVRSSILAADRSLSEAEQKIHEEKLKRDVVEQQNKYLEEQKTIQEQLIVDQQKSHEEHVQQLKMKMEEENERSREEIQRTLDAQHKEQMQRVEEGYKQKSLEMQKQMDQLRKEQKKKSKGFFGTIGGVFLDILDLPERLITSIFS